MSWLRREKLGITDLRVFVSQYIRKERIVRMRYLKIEREHFRVFHRGLALFRFHGLFLISTTFYLFLRRFITMSTPARRKQSFCNLQKTQAFCSCLQRRQWEIFWSSLVSVFLLFLLDFFHKWEVSWCCERCDQMT